MDEVVEELTTPKGELLERKTPVDELLLRGKNCREGLIRKNLLCLGTKLAR